MCCSSSGLIAAPQLIERVEGTIPQRRVDALIGQPYGVLDQRLVACLTDAGGHDDYPIVLGERIERGVDAGFVGVATTDRAAQVVRDDDLGAAAAVAQRPLVGADPVLALLRGAGLHVGQLAGAEIATNVSTGCSLPLSGSTIASLSPA